MAYSIAVSETAEHDLADIVDYLNARSGGPSAAAAIIDELSEIIDNLTEFPEMYPVVRDEILASVGYRWASAGNYLAFYTIDEEKQSVSIERVLHGKQNWRAII